MISVCIPVYEMQGQGEAYLKRALNSLQKQTFKDFEVCISDDSDNDLLKILTQEFDLNIQYERNLGTHGMASNTNNAMRMAKGEIIKILYQDDYLQNENSLKEIANSSGDWLVSGCLHLENGQETDPHYAAYSPEIIKGLNTIGSPSVLAIKNKDLIFFDEELTWVLDCDYYKRLFDRYGEPVILNSLNVVIGKGEHQVSNRLSEQRKNLEVIYLRKKYHV